VNNTHNTHLWSAENPHKISVHNFQNKSSLIMWRKILNRLIGSRFKTPSKRANVPQHITQSTASTSW